MASKQNMYGASKIWEHPLVIKVKKALEARGAKTIRSLGRTFRLLDSYDRNRKVDPEEFFVGLQENGVKLDRSESNELMTVFDLNGDGVIDYDEFLFCIRGQPNARRQTFIDKAFLKMDKDGSGQIDINDIKGTYNVSMHPKFKSGEMSETQILNEFLQSFGDVDKNGKVSRPEWNDYYAAVSGSVDNDDHFIMIMKNAWKL